MHCYYCFYIKKVKTDFFNYGKIFTMKDYVIRISNESEVNQYLAYRTNHPRYIPITKYSHLVKPYRSYLLHLSWLDLDVF